LASHRYNNIGFFLKKKKMCGLRSLEKEVERPMSHPPLLTDSFRRAQQKNLIDLTNTLEEKLKVQPATKYK